MLEMFVSPETHVQVAHASWVMLVCHFVDHVGGQCAVRALSSVAPLRRDAGLETLGEVVKQWDQAGVLVQPGEAFRRELRRCVRPNGLSLVRTCTHTSRAFSRCVWNS